MTIRLVYSSATTTQLIAPLHVHAIRAVQLDVKTVLQHFALVMTTQLIWIIWCARNTLREFIPPVSVNAIPLMFHAYRPVHETTMKILSNVHVDKTAQMAALVTIMSVRNQQRPPR